MRIKKFELLPTDNINKDIEDELRYAYQVIMKFGYPHGKDGDEYLIIYALFKIRD